MIKLKILRGKSLSGITWGGETLNAITCILRKRDGGRFKTECRRHIYTEKVM